MMAKSEKGLVAKIRFDDGSKVGPDGKSKAYEIGEEYQGKGSIIDELQEKGLLCKEADLAVDKKSLDKRDKEIAELQKENDRLVAENKAKEEQLGPDED